MTDVRGLRRILRRGPMAEEELDNQTGDYMAVLLALELARDLARINAMRAETPDAVGPWRSRRYVINTVIDAMLVDLAAGDAAQIEAIKSVLGSSAYIPGRSRRK
jgi:hypothetical protein